MANDIPLPLFDSKMYPQRRADIFDARATPISKNILAAKSTLKFDGAYHPFVTSKTRVPFQLFICHGIYMEDIITRIEEKLNPN